MMRLITCLCLFVAMGTVCHSAIVYDLFLRTSRGDSLDLEYNVAPQDQLLADVILRETVTAPDDPNIGATGLGAFGFMISSTGGDGTFSITSRPNFQLTTFNTDDTVGGANIFGVVAPTTDRGNGVFESTLATVQLTAPTAGRTVFELLDPRSGASDFAGVGAGKNIDDASIRTRSLSLITAVPEPSSLAFLTAVGTACVVGRRKRRLA
ncbi:hypothetical protein Enr13x_14510 [Stieleria neptunia]|uniref:PEP-CTERM protein-sorting domain-containing protein n=1 Tax=Stieleria neptunia TaxID=2527979 RepID=A0A518HLC6_9BACT|nr:PEP-CTERM sorting domain-containing protein [Stieleria neptunia]QDV41608.1 hypothetical protein Enr13x_14510 [Stieleria neptunia]